MLSTAQPALRATKPGALTPAGLLGASSVQPPHPRSWDNNHPARDVSWGPLEPAQHGPRQGSDGGKSSLPLGQKDSRPRTGPCWCWVCGENTLRGECGSCSQRPGFGYRLCHPTSCVSLGTFLSLSEPQFSHVHPLPLGQGLRLSCLHPHPAPEQTGTC